MKKIIFLLVILVYSILDCCAAEIGDLHEAISKVARIKGISGSLDDKSKIRIDFIAGASEQEKADAQRVLQEFNVNEKGEGQLNAEINDELIKAARDESISDEKFMMIQVKIQRAKLAETREKKAEKLQDVKDFSLEKEEIKDAKSP